MQANDIRLVQESFEKVAPIADTAAALFYDRLFTLDPSLRPLFKSDLKAQGKKLMAALALAVRGLHKPAQIIPAVQQLGRRHVAYGVQPSHYETVGQALLWTLAQGLGEEFTPEVEAAWTTAYNTLASLMLAAAQDAGHVAQP
jgi:hemoglobin-like flavoprotein